MIRILATCALVLATACVGDESVARYGASGKVWRLVEIDGVAFKARATMELDAAGWIKGHAPCNRFSLRQTEPYPWFNAGPAMATKMACPDLDSENRFFSALSDMSLSEVSETTLLLTNDAGRVMVFKAE